MTERVHRLFNVQEDRIPILEEQRKALIREARRECEYRIQKALEKCKAVEDKPGISQRAIDSANEKYQKSVEYQSVLLDFKIAKANYKYLDYLWRVKENNSYNAYMKKSADLRREESEKEKQLKQEKEADYPKPPYHDYINRLWEAHRDKHENIWITEMDKIHIKMDKLKADRDAEKEELKKLLPREPWWHTFKPHFTNKEVIEKNQKQWNLETV